MTIRIRISRYVVCRTCYEEDSTMSTHRDQNSPMKKAWPIEIVSEFTLLQQIVETPKINMSMYYTGAGFTDFQ